jgi:hypothetical protein
MTRSSRRQGPAAYTLLVDGHLDHHWSSWFDDLTLTHNDDGTTSLCGAVSDQSQLHGLLIKIRDLGLTLIALDVTGVTRVTDVIAAAGATADDPLLGASAALPVRATRSRAKGAPPENDRPAVAALGANRRKEEHPPRGNG